MGLECLFQSAAHSDFESDCADSCSFCLGRVPAVAVSSAHYVVYIA